MTPAGTNLLLAHADAAPAADPVTKSLRFDDGDAPFLQRTTGTSSDQTKCTHSFWMKRGALGANQRIFEGGGNGGFLMNGYSSSDEFRVNNDGPYAENTTTQLLRDISAFYHICVSIDSTQSSSSDRLKLYINGTQVTSFSRTDTVDLDSDQALNPSSGTYATIGKAYGGGEHFDGYLADYYMLDGVAAAATDFAEEDGTTGQWKPIAYSGSYGDNGFHLDFEDDTAIGNDVSGNDNDFTATNLAASDVVNDRPTDNYAVLNPLVVTSSGAGGDTFSEGNTKVVTKLTSRPIIPSTIFMPPDSGTYYAEFTLSGNGAMFGIVREDSPNDADAYYDSKSWSYYGHTKVNNGTSTALSGSAPSYPAKLGASYNTATDEGELKFYVGGVDVGGFTDLSTDYSYGFFVGDGSGAVSYTITTHFDSDDWDNTPSGVIQLSTANLPTPTIKKGVTYFDTKIYDDGAGAKTFDNGTVSMQPDLVWAKSRGSSNDHKLTDSVREEQNSLESNTTDTEVAESSNVGVMSFDADGFTIGSSSSTTGPYADQTGDGMVAWAWKKDATAGFNIVGWTGDDDGFSGGTQAVAHGLGVAPEMVIAKNRTDEAGGNGNWIVYHKDTSSGDLLKLNSTDGEFTPNATLIGSIGEINVSFGNDSTNSEYLNSDNSFGSGTPDTYIGYFFASVAGFSKVGSFSGTSTQFIYTGFRPSFILAKRYDSTGGNWLMFDDKREGYNVDNDDLFANENYDENTTDHIDILSNGFKIRTSDSDLNAGTVIYYAVAKNPFKYASAR